MHITYLAGSSTPQGYNPSQIRTAYGLPSSGGAGITIAVIDAYETPNILTDYTIFSNQFGLPDNSTGNFIVYKMPDTIETDSGWAEETCLDVQWAHAIAPQAKILLVEAVNSYSSSLISAVDYATSYPGVVAVSMSWGSNETSSEVNSDYHFKKPNIAFFAASGDDGSGIGPYWPAVSPNVVAVGGTTLSLSSTISETAWSKSGGGISKFELRPSYQTSYGLNTNYRTIPDVSYNANPTTGVSVCNNSKWITMGGTSAGAPQWAAIYALDLSATNTNLYQRAKSSYSSYFRDITSGSNGAYTAAIGYDNVTGLGSPLTYKFGTSLEVSPSSGPPNGSITLIGSGFAANSSVNISYLNPLTNNWVPVINNFNTTTGNFTYPMIAPDLGQNNNPGDHQTIFDNIIFRSRDNSNNRLYNTTFPYAEGRRGLTQISDTLATLGLFGNTTDLASTVFVQNHQSIVVAGSWFSPGSATLLWNDTISLGNASIDELGSFNTNVQVPTTTAGKHKLTINDGSGPFCINLTRLPAVANDYIDGWHTSDITINLTPDYPMNETFYRINGGSINNITSNGQPIITTEGSNNFLEYWSKWNVYGTGINETPHVTLTGIKLEKTAPTGDISAITITTNPPTVTLALSANDTVSENIQMHFSNDNISWSNWEPYAPMKTWGLIGGDGQKTVFVQFINDAGLSSTYSCNLILETPQTTVTPTQTPTPTEVPASISSPSPTSLPTLIPTPNTTTSLTPTETQTPTLTSVPEFSEWVLILIALSSLILILLFKRKK
jgi:subtilase family serine protease